MREGHKILLWCSSISNRSRHISCPSRKVKNATQKSCEQVGYAFSKLNHDLCTLKADGTPKKSLKQRTPENTVGHASGRGGAEASKVTQTAAGVAPADPVASCAGAAATVGVHKAGATNLHDGEAGRQQGSADGEQQQNEGMDGVPDTASGGEVDGEDTTVPPSLPRTGYTACCWCSPSTGNVSRTRH